MRRRRLLSLVALVAILLTLPVLGQEAGNYDLSWSTFSSGGGSGVNGPYALVDSFAAPDADSPMVGGTFILQHGFLPGAVAPPPNALQAHPWPMFRHDWHHRAVSPYTAYAQGELKWSLQLGDAALYSSPAIASDGTIYVGSYDGYLYAVNPSGTLKWKYAAAGRIYSSPALGADGTIYVGDLDTFKLHAVSPTGTLKWSFATGAAIESSPTIGPDGTIYVGSHDDKLYALRPDGVMKWSYTTEGDVRKSVALAADGTVYVASTNKLYALHANGSSRWTYTAPEIIDSSPAVAASDGTIYFTFGSKIAALWPSGESKWSKDTFATIFSSPAIDAAGVVYFGRNSYGFFAYYPDGSQKWFVDTSQSVHSSPAIGADGTIYFGANNDNLYAVNPGGTVKWTYLTGGDVQASPAIGADGTIYVTSVDKKLYAIGQRRPVAVTGFTTGVDADGAAGLVPAILQVKDPVTGDPKPEVLVGGFRASFFYPQDMLQLVECRLKAPFDAGECHVDAAHGKATIAAIEEPGAPWPVDPLIFLAVELNSCVGETGTATLFFDEIVDVDNSPVLPMAGITFQRGDATGEGEIGIGDALFIAQHIVGLRGLGLGPDTVNAVNAAAVKHDDGIDQISVADAVLLLQYLVGLRDGCFGLVPLATPPVR